MSTPTYNKREVHRILRDNGWDLDRTKGGHAIYKNAKNQHLTIAYGKCNKMVLQRLMKQYGIKCKR